MARAERGSPCLGPLGVPRSQVSEVMPSRLVAFRRTGGLEVPLPSSRFDAGRMNDPGTLLTVMLRIDRVAVVGAGFPFKE